MSIHDSIAAITSPGDSLRKGSVYLFGESEVGLEQIQKLQANDGRSGDLFGTAVALHRGLFAIGDSNKGGPNGATGAAYIFGPQISRASTSRLREARGLGRNVWLVGGEGSDFDEIQLAINAANPGDLIIVRPDHEYASFTLNKGVTIRSTQTRFSMRYSSSIRIDHLPAGQTAGIAGFTMSPGRRVGDEAKLVISNRRDWIESPGIEGAPAAVVPGDVFIVIDAGTIGFDPLRKSVMLKAGIEITGSILTFQTIITNPTDGSITLSNAVTRIVGIE